MKDFYEDNRKAVIVASLIVFALVAVVAVNAATDGSVVDSITSDQGDAMERHSDTDGDAMMEKEDGDAMEGETMEKDGDAMEGDKMEK